MNMRDMTHGKGTAVTGGLTALLLTVSGAAVGVFMATGDIQLARTVTFIMGGLVALALILLAILSVITVTTPYRSTNKLAGAEAQCRKRIAKAAVCKDEKIRQDARDFLSKPGNRIDLTELTEMLKVGSGDDVTASKPARRARKNTDNVTDLRRAAGDPPPSSGAPAPR